MKRIFLVSAILLAGFAIGYAECKVPNMIEVSGSATLNIVPDRITIEIGLEEYYRHTASGDSVIVRLADIENDVRNVLLEAGIPGSLVFVSDMGNYRNPDVSATFLMAKRISATVSDFNQIDRIASRLDRKGISSFTISRIDNSDIERYNREGLKAALNAARDKAVVIAENEGLKLLAPCEIVETTNAPARYAAFSNVEQSGGSGMENMRRIVRRYSVKVSYLFSVK